MRQGRAPVSAAPAGVSSRYSGAVTIKHGNAPSDRPVTGRRPRGKGQIDLALQHNHQIECPKNQYAKRPAIGKEMCDTVATGRGTGGEKRHLVHPFRASCNLCAGASAAWAERQYLGAGLACRQRVAPAQCSFQSVGPMACLSFSFRSQKTSSAKLSLSRLPMRHRPSGAWLALGHGKTTRGAPCLPLA